MCTNNKEGKLLNFMANAFLYKYPNKANKERNPNKPLSTNKSAKILFVEEWIPAPVPSICVICDIKDNPLGPIPKSKEKTFISNMVLKIVSICKNRVLSDTVTNRYKINSSKYRKKTTVTITIKQTASILKKLILFLNNNTRKINKNSKYVDGDKVKTATNRTKNLIIAMQSLLQPISRKKKDKINNSASKGLKKLGSLAIDVTLCVGATPTTLWAISLVSKNIIGISK